MVIQFDESLGNHPLEDSVDSPQKGCKKLCRLITVVYNCMQCVRRALTLLHLTAVCSGWPSELVTFAHVVHCPLLPVTVQQCHVIGCGLHILVYFYSMVTACFEELESHVCSHCHLQAPCGVDAIK